MLPFLGYTLLTPLFWFLFIGETQISDCIAGFLFVNPMIYRWFTVADGSSSIGGDRDRTFERQPTALPSFS